MKKKAVVLFAGLLACSAMLGGCGGNQASNDYVKVGGYKGIEVDKVEDKQEVSDEDVDNYIQAVRQQNMAEAEGAAAEDGDTVNIDFVGKMDGQEFDGGSAQGQEVTIGSGSFIDGFEDSIIGHKAGETYDWNGQFPDPYEKKPEYAGKPVTFTITVNSVMRMPELTDEFVQTISEESKTVDEYKEEVKKLLEDSAEDNYQYDLESEAWDAVVEKAEVISYPEDEVKETEEQIINNYKSLAEAYGMEYEDYITSQGMEVEDFEKQVSDAAESSVKQKYLAQAIAEKEKLTLTDKEYEEEFKKLAEEYGYPDVDTMKESASEDELKNIVLQNKVKEWLADNCIQVVNESAE